MNHTIKELSDTQRLLEVTLDASDLKPIKQQALAKLAKNIKIAGFRPGKAPAHIAEKQIDPNVLQNEVIEHGVNSSATKALDEGKIVPLDTPKIQVKKFVPDQRLEYTAEFEVIPKIKLGDYKKLKVVKNKVIISEKDVDEIVERMRRADATKKEVTRQAKIGDEVIIDFLGTDKDGKEVTGAKGQDYPLVLGSGSFIPGFEQGIESKKTGANFTLPLTFPKDYHHKPLAGAKVNFAVTVKKINEVTLPKLDDEFAKKSGAFATMAELKKDIKDELAKQKEREALDKQKDLLIEKLVNASKIPVPEVLVEDQIKSLERDFIQNLLYRGLTLDQYLQQQGLTKEQWQKGELHEQAVRRVQVGLALSQLSQLEKIEVTQAELEKRLADLIASYGKDPNLAKQLDTPEARRDIGNRVLTEKTLDRLIELNK